MIGGWSQILTNGDNLHANTCKINQGFLYFLASLAHAHNHSRLCSETRRSTTCKHRKAACISSRGPHCSLQSGNCLNVVIKHIRTFGNQYLECVSSFNIRNKCLDFYAKVQRTNCSHGVSYMLHSSINQIVTSHHCQHSKFKSHSLHCFGHAARFVSIGKHWLLCIDQTKSTRPCTPIAQHHKCCGAIIPTLAQVWAPCLFTHGHQI